MKLCRKKLGFGTYEKEVEVEVERRGVRRVKGRRSGGTWRS
jgi:hypothetical protein